MKHISTKTNTVVLAFLFTFLGLWQVNGQNQRTISVAKALSFTEDYGVIIKSSYTGSGSVIVKMRGINEEFGHYSCGLNSAYEIPAKILLYNAEVDASRRGQINNGAGLKGTVYNSFAFLNCVSSKNNFFQDVLTNWPSFYRRNIRTYNRVMNQPWFYRITERLKAATVPVTIEVEYTGDMGPEAIEKFVLPGITLTPEDLTNSTFVKGINFFIRKAVDNNTISSRLPKYLNHLEITENLISKAENLQYEIAVPRKLNTIPSTFKTRDAGSFTTNLIVYPKDNKFYVVSLTNPISKMAPNDNLICEEIRPIFKAKLNNESKTYKLYKITSPSNIGRVFITKVGKAGPFPAAKGFLGVKRIADTDINRKFLNKKDLADNEKFLIAWHRGFWRDSPENTLQSIDAARAYLASSDLLELDVSRAKDITSEGVHNYVLFHDPFMFRGSSTGPNKNEDQCIDPYDKLLVESPLLAAAKRDDLRNTLKSRFPGYTEEEYDNWIKGPTNFTKDQLIAMKVRDRFGCLTDITIPTLGEAIQKAKENNFPIIVDKGWDDIDGIYWEAIKNGYEDNVFFKGAADGRKVEKLRLMYGDEMFQQIAYTPFYFDNQAQRDKDVDFTNIVIWCEEFVTAEFKGWNIPGFELQIKLKVSDGSNVKLGFSPKGTTRLLDFNKKYTATKWMGITQVNPTAYNGFDNKIIFMDVNEIPTDANPYSSRWDRRADLDFNLNYIKADYWTTDRPDVVHEFLKTIGKFD